MNRAAEENENMNKLCADSLQSLNVPFCVAFFPFFFVPVVLKSTSPRNDLSFLCAALWPFLLGSFFPWGRSGQGEKCPQAECCPEDHPTPT